MGGKWNKNETTHASRQSTVARCIRTMEKLLCETHAPIGQRQRRRRQTRVCNGSIWNFRTVPFSERIKCICRARRARKNKFINTYRLIIIYAFSFFFGFCMDHKRYKFVKHSIRAAARDIIENASYFSLFKSPINHSFHLKVKRRRYLTLGGDLFCRENFEENTKQNIHIESNDR